MSPKKFKLILLLFIFFCLSIYSQNLKKKDSLEFFSYNQLYKRFKNNKNENKSLAAIYANSYYLLAKKDNDYVKIAYSYVLKSELYHYTDRIKLKLLDSAIAFADSGSAKNFPENMLTRRGVTLDDQGNFKDALKDYLRALEYSKINQNETYEYSLKHNIALIKRKLGKYEEAKILLNECLIYEEGQKSKSNDKMTSYLLTLTELASVYRLNNQLDSAKALNQIGLKNPKNQSLRFLFDLNNGIHYYYDGKFNEAKYEIERTLPKLFDPKNHNYVENYNLMDAYFHLGKTHKYIEDKKKSIIYFKKIDSMASSKNYFIPEHRLAYVELINHYKSAKNYPYQLKYVNKLLEVDSIINNNYRFINDKLIRDFDTKELIEEKEILIKSINSKNKTFENLIIYLLSILSITFIFVYYLYKKRKRDIQRFKNIINKQSEFNKANSILVSKKKYGKNEIGISEEIVDELSKKLDDFESNLDFLKPNVTTSNMAKKFNTNSKYISKVVHFYKKKSFSSYINDLRIEYVLNKLKTETKFRNYTVKAISEEIGFNNVQSFSSCFYKKTGLYPSFFIKKLNKL